MTASRILSLLALATLAACADRPPMSPGDPPPFIPTPANPTGATRVDCVARVSEGTVSCSGSSTSAGARRAIIGGQGEFINITATGVSFNSGTGIFQGDFTVQNLLPYPIGTRNGVDPDTGGVKVFIYQGPTTTGGGGDVTVANPDGLGTLTAANQPFFKYAQLIRPDSVSAPRTWQFQLDAGVTSFTFSLLVYAETQASAFRLILPEPNDTVLADSVEVRVVAAAPPRLNNILATVVGGASAQLTYSDSGIWRGKVPLSGNAGARTLRVRARSPLQDSLVQTVPFVYGLGPSLTLTHPAWRENVSRPLVRFAGSCTDNTACTVTGRNGNTVIFTAPGPSFDLTVPLTDGTRGEVTVTGTDTDGNTVTLFRYITVEGSARLVEVSPGRQVYAASPDAFFYRDSSAVNGAMLRLRQRSVDSADVLVMQVPPRTSGLQEQQWRVGDALITQGGVAFMTGPYFSEYANGIMEYTRGQIFLGSMNTAGRWLNFAGVGTSEGSSIVLRDVLAGTRATVGIGRHPRVAENGDVVYEYRDSLYRARGGTVTPIHGTCLGAINPNCTPDSSPPPSRAVTDGNLIAFREGTLMMLYDGSGPPFPVGTSGPNYAINNGWLAWTGHVRHPNGTVYQLISTGSFFAIRAIGPNGEVVYQDGERRWYSAHPYTTRMDVGRDWGELVHFFGTRAFVTVGDVATFEIVP